ncbi:MAG: PQQ-binding-like beta-propeller repeat protein [Eubacteriales bacterium]|nr:PQQ-binding-like beta-propeller repeat protein [Eubacteriales bacterium]
MSKRTRRKKNPRLAVKRILIALEVLVLGIILTIIFFPKEGLVTEGTPENGEIMEEAEKAVEEATEEAAEEPEEEKELVGAVGDVEFVPASEQGPEFHPRATEETKPSNFIATTEIKVGEEVLTSLEEYKPKDNITFDLPGKYTDVEGIVTFRGNNFRDNPTYGTATFTENKLEEKWSVPTGGLTYGDATWTGSGWTGQPLMEKWSKETKQHMNMYDWAKEKDDLVEVIYACMDGYVYFLDLETGEATRDALYLGFTFKGSGALDPRGYPILYVGAGYNSNQGTARVFIVNLLDCSVLTTFGNDDPFSLRGSLSFFDSSCLIDAETDTMIYPGENGILYLMKLNTSYNEETGELSFNPDPMVRWHYYGVRSSAYSFWLGMEDSCAVYQGYLFVTDNGGNLMCLDLNTLQLVWAQDTLDDSNSTPVLSVENGHLYLYVSTSFRLGWRSSTTAEVPIWKIDAETGEIVWKVSYECYTEDGVSGGVQSTIALGKNELNDYIYVTVARTGQAYDGVLTCINKNTGEVAWEHTAYYAWSSPVCVYDEEGNGRVLYCSCGGKMYFMNGITGEVLDTLEVSDGAIEASPAVYNNHIVIGTRSSQIKGIDIK